MISDTVQLALIAGVVSAIATLPATIAALSARKNAKDAATQATAAATLGQDNKGKLTEIHIATNSNLAEVKGDLKIANEKIAGLERLVSTALQVTPPGAVGALPVSNGAPIPVVDEATGEKLDKIIDTNKPG